MLIEMKVAGLAIDPLTNMPILLLRDLEEVRTIPIWIGLVEASSIATELQEVELARPMTHDLVRNLLVELGAEVMHVEVNDLRDNTYYATLVVKHGGRVLELDARPSDAIAIAMRCGCSVYVDEQVLTKAGCMDLRGDTPPRPDPATDILGALPDNCFGKWKM